MIERQHTIVDSEEEDGLGAESDDGDEPEKPRG